MFGETRFISDQTGTRDLSLAWLVTWRAFSYLYYINGIVTVTETDAGLLGAYDLDLVVCWLNHLSRVTQDIKITSSSVYAQEAENYSSPGDSLSSNCQVIRQEPRYRLSKWNYQTSIQTLDWSDADIGFSVPVVKFPWHAQIPKTAASMICVTTLHGNSLPTHSIQNPMSWNNQMNIFRHKPFELPVSPTQPVQSTSMLIWLQSISEFIGQLDDNFPQSLIVKYSDKTDSPLKRVNGKLDNSNDSLEQTRHRQNLILDY